MYVGVKENDSKLIQTLRRHNCSRLRRQTQVQVQVQLTAWLSRRCVVWRGVVAGQTWNVDIERLRDSSINGMSCCGERLISRS